MSTQLQITASPYHEAYWIASEVILCMIGSYFLYLFVALSVYAWRQKALQRERRTLLYVVIACLFFSIGRIISDEVVAFLAWNSDAYCFVGVSVSIALYYGSFMSVMVFLWLRQNYFYANPILIKLLSKKVLYFSRATLCVLVLGGIAVVVLFQIPSATGWVYRATPTGCRDANDQQDFELIPFTFLSITLMGQVALLSLLVYPLLVRKKKQKRMRKNTETRLRRPSSPKPEHMLLRKALLASYHENRKKALSFAGSVSQPQDREHELPLRLMCSEEDDVFKDSSDSSGNIWTDSTISSDSDNALTSSSIAFNKRLKKKRMPFVKRDRTDTMDSTRSFNKTKKMLRLKKRKRSNSHAKREKELNKLMTKVFLLALICVVSSIVATILQLVFIFPELVYLAMFDVNLAINISCIIYSFSEWMNMTGLVCFKRFYISKFAHRRTAAFTEEIPLPVRSRSQTNQGCSEGTGIKIKSESAAGLFSASIPNSPNPTEINQSTNSNIANQKSNIQQTSL